MSNKIGVSILEWAQKYRFNRCEKKRIKVLEDIQRDRDLRNMQFAKAVQCGGFKGF